jgi:Undecaprenyl-phosphate galactose phosphotransferase WbaP
MFRGFSGMLPLLILSDLLALFVVCVGSVWVQRCLVDESLSIELYWRLAPCLFLFIAVKALVGLYPGIMLSPPEELKKITQSVSVTFLTLAGGIFVAKQGALYSRGIFFMAWIGALVALPLFRSMLRRIAFRGDLWGYPAVILGAGETGRAVVAVLSRNHRLGLRAVAFLDDDADKRGRTIDGILVRGALGEAPTLAAQYRDAVAIVAMPGISPARLVEVLERPAAAFRRLIIVPDLFGASSLWVSAFDMAGIIGLEVRQKLLDPRRRLVKRAMELAMIALFLPLLLPLLGLIALLVKLDSAGPVLFRHDRIGLGGRDISILKFRTMVRDADAVLRECLAHDPDLRAEWDANHKLAHDPRITRFGRFLRKTSLDELPQLWNVIRGDLSLVGPRPIVWDEVEKYEGGFELYKKVRPGLTGWWQISGRSDTTYAERVRLDAYYVRNWSVWFDIYILLKTPGEVFRCRGAC